MTRAAATLAVFGATLALVLRRPRGWNEAWWALAGAAVMMGLVVLVVVYLILRRLFRAPLRRSFDVGRLRPAASGITDPRLFRASCLVLAAVGVGYFVGPPLGVPVYAVAFAGAAALAIY